MSKTRQAGNLLWSDDDTGTDWGLAILSVFVVLIGLAIGPFLLVGLPIMLGLLLPASQRAPALLACIPAYVIGAAFTAEAVQMVFGRKKAERSEGVV